MGRGRQGPAPDVEKRQQFARLIGQGVSNRRACQIVGIARKTGTRWRLGRTILNTAGEPVHYPPVGIAAAPRERHARNLSLEERMAIADLRREKKGVREIAAQIGRSRATVSRELRPQHRFCRPIPASWRGPSR